VGWRETARRTGRTLYGRPNDAQRRFRMMADVAELQRALDFPWEKWTIFLHRPSVRFDAGGLIAGLGLGCRGTCIAAYSGRLILVGTPRHYDAVFSEGDAIKPPLVDVGVWSSLLCSGQDDGSQVQISPPFHDIER
jgi:hypothetical protein